MDISKILNTELQYARVFSSVVETDELLWFRNPFLPDMYYHNFSFLKPVDEERLLPVIESEISRAQQSDAEFLTLVTFQRLSPSLLEMIEGSPEISVSGYYVLDNTRQKLAGVAEGCSVRKVVDEKMVNDATYIKVSQYGADGKEEFWTRVMQEKGAVHLGPANLSSYVCYDHLRQPVGNCDLFLDGNLAKIEDFDVITTQQRKGYGTAILQTLIDEAVSKGAKTIYLVADENDTAKEMYQKLGFSKVHEVTDLFFPLKKPL